MPHHFIIISYNRILLHFSKISYTHKNVIVVENLVGNPQNVHHILGVNKSNSCFLRLYLVWISLVQYSNFYSKTTSKKFTYIRGNHQSISSQRFSNLSKEHAPSLQMHEKFLGLIFMFAPLAINILKLTLYMDGIYGK